ncbi:hypothetical protein EJ419_06470 [Alloscardovia theropitheci]|uniref:DUF2087 domain-containing protein n=1 Tax=Alloscardovia theropitheci TaxID=2496842 RepID=A0A4R0QNW6_9BIFI|nr:hypothetical protein EJ419_06470 [Alloscardovia theropitheci]
MRLPNKLYPYGKSVLYYLPKILKKIDDGDTDIRSLFDFIKSDLESSTDFLEIMDCLYALRAIDMSDDGTVYRAY